MKVNSSIICRHPKVIMIHDHREDSGAAAIISDCVRQFRSFRIGDEAVKAIQEYQPYILLIEVETVADALRHYVTLVKEFDCLQHPHHVVLLCPNKEVGLAYDICSQGVFYDYFVSRPMYEKYRLKSIINTLAKSYDENELLLDKSAEYIDENNCDIVELIDEIKAMSSQVEETIADCKTSIKQDLSAEQHAEQVSDTVSELLNKIEGDIHQSLAKIMAGLTQHKEKNLDGKNLLEQAIKQRSTQQIDKLAKLKAKQKTDTLANSSDPTSVEPVETAAKILLVEDNHIYRDMIKQILQKADYKVDESADGMEALRQVKKSKYDLIIMDLFMPKLDGLNTTKQFRKMANKKDLPIIALTSNKNKELVQKWVKYGINSYIMKPSKQENILAAVDKALS
ncbi:response regulator [Catenovulum sp. SM1970]|uniref:response regulator n=1 Tax=Marinifaba aquimaris TaxID=2741323 RepID=UPI0015732599|nr:response regulator [Marinifaba aquimaris]NTS77130.1 response regulator [Marinifaba aquimaris]